jgi:hypothetical protein
VWGHDSASPVEVSDLTGLLASAWMDGVVAKYLLAISTVDTLDLVLARQVFDPLNPGDTKNEAARVVGTAGSVSVSNRTATELTQMMKLGSDAAGRSAHGRVFLPWSYDRDQTLGEVFLSATTARSTAIATELLKLAYNSGSHASGAAADFDLALYSSTLRARDADQYGYRVIAVAPSTRVHWLRSRGATG